MRHLARQILRVESALWSVLGILLIAGGFIVLGGGSGIPGVVNVDEPGFGHGTGAWAVGLGVAVLMIGAWGIWIAASLRRGTLAARLNALLFCAVWIALGLVWILVATTPIPGAITLIVNAVMLLGFLARPTSIATSGQGR